MKEEPREPAPSEPSHVTDTPAKPPESSETPASSQLTPEEQMALFEKELKETDWGHQPC